MRFAGTMRFSRLMRLAGTMRFVGSLRLAGTMRLVAILQKERKRYRQGRTIHQPLNSRNPCDSLVRLRDTPAYSNDTSARLRDTPL